jgi:arginyl-tRNA synthetase
MSLNRTLLENVVEGIKTLYGGNMEDDFVQIQKTKKEFTGDVTVVVFPLLRFSNKSPEQTAEDVGRYLIQKIEFLKAFEVKKGFLNLTISAAYYIDFLHHVATEDTFGKQISDQESELIMVEYSSPNTNKPLHLGHIRNNLLGWSICKILEETGKKVVKTNLVNDRGIHICKSMLAWTKWGNNETPENTHRKGDHLVGDYYVKFEEKYRIEVKELMKQGLTQDEASKKAPLILEAQDMLRKWESGDPETRRLWSIMNGWVNEGFTETYDHLGVNFDKIYYESDTYTVGRDSVLKGLQQGIFYRHNDGSVWIDLTQDGLDEKVLLRSDGTSVYITQDIGTAQLRQQDFAFDQMIYVVGNEQNYHFKVLSAVLDKLGFPWAKSLHHLSYGMVELPEGRMKSREGTVVDADDLIDEMFYTARKMADELGKLEGLTDKEKESIYRIIGLGALKYFILKVDPAKNMTFNPEESIDFNGHTGPFIQYTHARICSVLRKADEMKLDTSKSFSTDLSISDKEKSIVKLIYEYPDIVTESAKAYNPALIANHMYDLAKEYNQFYHDHPILKEHDVSMRNFRICLTEVCSKVIKKGMNLLGIEVPERM